MSKFTSHIAGILRRRFDEAPAGTMARARLSRIGIPEANISRFCSELGKRLALFPVLLSVSPGEVPVTVYAFETFHGKRVFLGFASARLDEKAGEATVGYMSEGFAARLRDARSNPDSELYNSLLMFFVEREIDTLRASIDLTSPGEVLESSRIFGTIADEAASESARKFIKVAAPLIAEAAAARGPDGHMKILDALTDIANEVDPKIGIRLPDILDCMPDKEFDDFLVTRQKEGVLQERMEKNRRATQVLRSAQDAANNAEDILDGHLKPEAINGWKKIPTHKADYSKWLQDQQSKSGQQRVKWERFRFRNLKGVVGTPDSKSKTFDAIVQLDSSYQITSQYEELPPGPVKVRLYVNGRLEIQGDPVGETVSVQGRDITLQIASPGPSWTFYQLEILAGKQSARGKAHSVIRVAVPPLGTPRFSLPRFRIEAIDEPCIVIESAEDALVLPEDHTRGGLEFSLAIRPDQATPLPARLAAPRDEVTMWHFEQGGFTFQVPLRCLDIVDTQPQHTTPFRSAIHLIAGGDEPVMYWQYDDQLRQLWVAEGGRNRNVSVDARTFLVWEREMVEGRIFCPAFSAEKRLEMHSPPWFLEDHPFVRGIRDHYEGIFSWLQTNKTLPSLVGNAPEYWNMVQDLLDFIEAGFSGNSLDNDKLGPWMFRLGAIVDSQSSSLLFSTPLAPVHLAHALSIFRRVQSERREGNNGAIPPQRLSSITPEGLMPCALQSAESAPNKRSIPKRTPLATWLRWIPASDFVDDDITNIRTIVCQRLLRFLDAFPQLVGNHPDAPLLIRFVGVSPNENVVKGIEDFLEQSHKAAIQEDPAIPILQICAEFYMEDPAKTTFLDARMSPDSTVEPAVVEGRDLLHQALKYAKRSVRSLAAERDSPRRYAHITFIAQGFDRRPSLDDHREYSRSARLGGVAPAPPTRLAHLAAGKNDAIVFGSLSRLEPIESVPPVRFAAYWNELQGAIAESLSFTSRNHGKVPVVLTPPNPRFALDWIYPSSQWVVHLEPGVSLIPLTRNRNEQVLIHFTDQLNPNTFGFDEVTLTYRASSFRLCLDALCAEIGIPHDKELLSLLNTINPQWTLKLVAGRGAMHGRIDILAATLSGTYALNQAKSLEPGYTWLIAGWEDFVRNTGATGLPLRDGLLERGKGTDDIVLIGLNKERPGELRILLVESKYGAASWRDGIEQVKQTSMLLQRVEEGRDRLQRRLILAEFGRYTFRVAERMYVHGLLSPSELEVVDSLQDHLLEGETTLIMPGDEKLPQKGFVIHVDPDASEGRKLKVTDGIIVVSIPWAGIASMTDAFAIDALALAEDAYDPKAEADGIGVAVAVSDAALQVLQEIEPEPLNEQARATVPLPVLAPASAEEMLRDDPAPMRGWTHNVIHRIETQGYEPPRVDKAKYLRIDDYLHALKVEVDPPEEDDIVVGPQAILVHLKPRPGTTVTNLERALGTLQVNMGISQALSLSMSEHPGYVTIFFPMAERRPIPYRSFVEAQALESRVLPVPAGLQGTNKMLWLDLLETNHLLVAGSTGSGKTVYLQTLIATAAIALPPDRLEIAIIDPKMLDFVALSDLPHMVGSIIYDSEEAYSFLSEVLEDIQDRQRVLFEAKCKNISAFHRKGGNLPYRLIVVDEYNQLRMSMPKGGDKELEKVVCKIAQIGRAFGVYLVLATQRPSTDVVSGDIKANFPTRVSFRLPTHTDSQVILDSKGAESLLQHGDGIIAGQGALQRFQALYIDETSLEEIVQAIKNTWAKLE
jgi:hypothetical protein